MTPRKGPFWDAVGASLVDVGGENKPCLLELWRQGVAYGRAVEKAKAYRCAANQIDSGATANDLRAIADGVLGVGIDESRDAGQTGPCARAQVTPANSDADCACCDSVPTPNVGAQGRAGCGVSPGAEGWAGINTYSTMLSAAGGERPSSRRPSRWNWIAKSSSFSVSSTVAPVATQPGRSGTYPEKLLSAFSITIA